MTEPFDDKSEVDHHVASSRAGKSDGRDDTHRDDAYVGQSSPDDDFDAGETGAEARNQQQR